MRKMVGNAQADKGPVFSRESDEPGAFILKDGSRDFGF